MGPKWTLIIWYSTMLSKFTIRSHLAFSDTKVLRGFFFCLIYGKPHVSKALLFPFFTSLTSVSTALAWTCEDRVRRQGHRGGIMNKEPWGCVWAWVSENMSPQQLPWLICYQAVINFFFLSKCLIQFVLPNPSVFVLQIQDFICGELFLCHMSVLAGTMGHNI